MVARLLAVLAVALVVVPSASAAAPTGLHGFVLRSSEAPNPHTFARTPAFTWTRVTGAGSYEFQLSTSKKFSDNSIVWESDTIKAPMTAVPLTLPWVTGSPYSWYARVRGNIGKKVSAWSTSYGFNLKPPSAPTSLSNGANPIPGMIRWTPVEGATAYQVSFIFNGPEGRTRIINSPVNAADLREYYDFHNQMGSSPAVEWRARAVRTVTSTKPVNNLPVVTYGPWSAINSTTEQDVSGAQISLGGTISRTGSSNNVVTGTGAADPHDVMPGFYWSGSLGTNGFGACPSSPANNIALTGVTCPLFHVYVFSDEDCVNRVYTSDLVGSPAFVPRIENPIDLPGTAGELTEAANLYLGNEGGGGEPRVYDAAGDLVHAAGTGPDAITGDVRTDGLWDSDWPTGRWWWTVVPSVPSLTPGNVLEYRDVEDAEDACHAGNLQGFGKTSDAAVAGASGVPYASGQVSGGTVRVASSKKPSFYGQVIAAWQPVPGAQSYEIQWSRTLEPWKTAGSKTTPETLAQLSLATGVWYYRVRGLDPTIPSTKHGMTWSDPQYLKILPRTFSVH